ncbi:monovalent cation/H+ antiporter subunit D [Verticiella sediminum]|uniref:Monovalent cation/H+ antiporter subunit D n=2 Tax=Verticiella sediminum TaxID=1247510 RepID=A0A556ASA2_9BURK|nr:monovalent cation/H+ antiporter subunit D [Verticiella sediminum]
MDHLLVLMVALPLLVGGAMLLLSERRRALKAALGLTNVLVLLGIAVTLAWRLNAGETWPDSLAVYLVSNWSAPFGISLVADRLSALMLVMTSVLALASLTFAVARWDRAGVHFHPLFQFMLMGVNGAFLTGDVFNLFVFFEIMLAASYGLVLHGSGWPRVKSGMHYIVINLLASSVFLVGVAMIYGVTGTLNMADLAAKVPHIAGADRVLLEAGAGVLAIAFLAKSAMWPLNFWLTPAYSAASPPVAAIFAILSKVGVYAVLRLWLLMFNPGYEGAPDFGGQWLVYGGLATLAFGSIGLLASQEFNRLACFSLIVSSGTLIAAVGFGSIEVTAGALFYMVSSTFAVAAFFLLIELVERTRVFGANVLALTMEAFQAEGAIESAEVDEVGVAIPMAMAFLGLAFFTCALLMAGLPPLSGFLAKFAILSAVLEPAGAATPWVTQGMVWCMIALVIVSGLAAVISLSRAGVRAFWAPADRTLPRLRVIEVGPIALLLGLCVAMTVAAGPTMRYMESAATALFAPTDYSRGVLLTPRVPSPSALEE